MTKKYKLRKNGFSFWKKLFEMQKNHKVKLKKQILQENDVATLITMSYKSNEYVQLRILSAFSD